MNTNEVGMSTCGNCRYFGDEVILDEWEEMPIRTGYHQCERIKHCEHFYNSQERDFSALVVDGSGYFAALRVTEDFGCIAFEKKP